VNIAGKSEEIEIETYIFPSEIDLATGLNQYQAVKM